MSFDDVRVHTTQLQTSSLTAKTGSSDTTNLSNDMGTAISDLVTSFAAVDILASVASSLETFNTGLMATLECFALGLTVIDNGLAISATAFKGLDSKLASIFTTMEGQLTYYTGYETTFAMPTVQVPSSITYKATTISLQAPPVHHSFWGSVGNFISKNAAPIGLFVAAGALVVVGAVLTPVTGGLSDVVTDTAAADLIATGAADLTATAAVDATTAATVDLTTTAATTATQAQYVLAA